jgi:tol-pal system protein YbgF
VPITRHVFWVALASVGCATPVKSLREDNRRLSQSVADLRADRRMQERKIRDLELKIAQLKIAKQSADQVPQLPVEVVAPPDYDDGQRLVAVAADGTEIIYEGDAALGKAAVVDDPPPVTRRPVERHEPPHRATPVSARLPRATPRRETSPAAADEYRAAVELVRTGKTDEAVTALRGFLARYPRHEYADNAQYWLGEAFYATKDYQHALVEFRATIETYPRGNKVPDALLKVGYCYQALGQTDKARAVLEQVVNLYPKSEPAALAAKRLELP